MLIQTSHSHVPFDAIINDCGLYPFGSHAPGSKEMLVTLPKDIPVKLIKDVKFGAGLGKWIDVKAGSVLTLRKYGNPASSCVIELIAPKQDKIIGNGEPIAGNYCGAPFVGTVASHRVHTMNHRVEYEVILDEPLVLPWGTTDGQPRMKIVVDEKDVNL